MSAIFNATAAARGIIGRSCVNGTAATLKRWWAAYVTWRLERAAINKLSSLNDREPELAMQIYKTRRGITTVKNYLPTVWRVNYLHEAPSPEMPEIAHEKAREILQENLFRAGL